MKDFLREIYKQKGSEPFPLKKESKPFPLTNFSVIGLYNNLKVEPVFRFKVFIYNNYFKFITNLIYFLFGILLLLCLSGSLFSINSNFFIFFIFTTFLMAIYSALYNSRTLKLSLRRKRKQRARMKLNKVEERIKKIRLKLLIMFISIHVIKKLFICLRRNIIRSNLYILLGDPILYANLSDELIKAMKTGKVFCKPCYKKARLEDVDYNRYMMTGYFTIRKTKPFPTRL